MYINFVCLQTILFHWLELNSFENFLNEIVKLKEISKQNVYWEIYIINKYIINFLNKTLVHFVTEIRSTRRRCSFSIVNPWKSFTSMKGFKEKISNFLCVKMTFLIICYCSTLIYCMKLSGLSAMIFSMGELFNMPFLDETIEYYITCRKQWKLYSLFWLIFSEWWFLIPKSSGLHSTPLIDLDGWRVESTMEH